jgi:hypothetical protein
MKVPTALTRGCEVHEIRPTLAQRGGFSTQRRGQVHRAGEGAGKDPDDAVVAR